MYTVTHMRAVSSERWLGRLVSVVRGKWSVWSDASGQCGQNADLHARPVTLPIVSRDRVSVIIHFRRTVVRTVLNQAPSHSRVRTFRVLVHLYDSLCSSYQLFVVNL